MVLASNCALFNEVFTIFGNFAQVIEIFIQSNEVVEEERVTQKQNKAPPPSSCHFYKHECMSHNVNVYSVLALLQQMHFE